MILERLSMYIAKTIKKLDPDGEESVEVLNYELSIRLNYAATFILTAILGWAGGEILYSLLSCCLFILIRKLSGGLHMKSITSCAIMSSLIFAFIPQIDLNDTMIYILTLISSIIYIVYAPNFMTDPIPEGDPRLRKVLAFTLCICNIFLASSVIALTFLVQAILILNWKGENRNEISTKDCKQSVS